MLFRICSLGLRAGTALLLPASVGSREQGPGPGFLLGCVFSLVSILSREVHFCKRAASGLKVILASFGKVQCFGVEVNATNLCCFGHIVF